MVKLLFINPSLDEPKDFYKENQDLFSNNPSDASITSTLSEYTNDIKSKMELSPDTTTDEDLKKYFRTLHEKRTDPQSKRNLLFYDQTNLPDFSKLTIPSTLCVNYGDNRTFLHIVKGPKIFFSTTKGEGIDEYPILLREIESKFPNANIISMMGSTPPGGALLSITKIPEYWNIEENKKDEKIHITPLKHIRKSATHYRIDPSDSIRMTAIDNETTRRFGQLAEENVALGRKIIGHTGYTAPEENEYLYNLRQIDQEPTRPLLRFFSPQSSFLFSGIIETSSVVEKLIDEENDPEVYKLNRLGEIVQKFLGIDSHGESNEFAFNIDYLETSLKEIFSEEWKKYYNIILDVYKERDNELKRLKTQFNTLSDEVDRLEIEKKQEKDENKKRGLQKEYDEKGEQKREIKDSISNITEVMLFQIFKDIPNALNFGTQINLGEYFEPDESGYRPETHFVALSHFYEKDTDTSYIYYRDPYNMDISENLKNNLTERIKLLNPSGKVLFINIHNKSFQQKDGINCGIYSALSLTTEMPAAHKALIQNPNSKSFSLEGQISYLEKAKSNQNFEEQTHNFKKPHKRKKIETVEETDQTLQTIETEEQTQNKFLHEKREPKWKSIIENREETQQTPKFIQIFQQKQNYTVSSEDIEGSSIDKSLIKTENIKTMLIINDYYNALTNPSNDPSAKVKIALEKLEEYVLAKTGGDYSFFSRKTMTDILSQAYVSFIGKNRGIMMDASGNPIPRNPRDKEYIEITKAVINQFAKSLPAEKTPHLIIQKQSKEYGDEIDDFKIESEEPKYAKSYREKQASKAIDIVLG